MRPRKAGRRRVPVDICDLARDILGLLRQGGPAREVDMVLAEGLTALADPKLVAIALENLLGNAWKGEVPHRPERCRKIRYLPLNAALRRAEDRSVGCKAEPRSGGHAIGPVQPRRARWSPRSFPMRTESTRT